MSELLLAFLATTIFLSAVLMTKYGWRGVAASLVIEGCLMFLLVFWSPVGAVMAGDLVESWNSIGAGLRYILTLAVLIAGIFGVSFSLSSKPDIVGKLRAGYDVTFQKIQWSAISPFLAIALAYGFLQPTAHTEALLAGVAPTAENFIIFSALAAGFIIPIIYIILKGR